MVNKPNRMFKRPSQKFARGNFAAIQTQLQKLIFKTNNIGFFAS